MPKAKTPHESEALQRQIVFTDRQIDEVVHELYGLTEDEMRVVEGAADCSRPTADGSRNRTSERQAVSRKPKAVIRMIEATDKRIDALVYELRGLTEDEIRIIEGSGA